MVELGVGELITQVGERRDMVWTSEEEEKKVLNHTQVPLLQLFKKQIKKVSGLCLNHSLVEGDASSHLGGSSQLRQD